MSQAKWNNAGPCNMVRLGGKASWLEATLKATGWLEVYSRARAGLAAQLDAPAAALSHKGRGSL